ncbi:Protein THEMIS [Manis javanica]|nr:Protein THEMIS [Manis javanica]
MRDSDFVPLLRVELPLCVRRGARVRDHPEPWEEVIHHNTVTESVLAPGKKQVINRVTCPKQLPEAPEPSQPSLAF